MDNPALRERIDRVIDALEGIEAALEMVLEEQERAHEREIARGLVRFAPRATAWPWTPNTVTQGFLAGRWLRRDGDVYTGAALRVVPGPNSPIAGGPDFQAKVDVPSGTPRS